MKSHKERWTFRLAAAALLWNSAAAALLYFLPLSSSVTDSAGGAQVESSESLFSADPSSIGALLIPVLLSAIATWAAARRSRWLVAACAALLTVFAALALLSVGIFFVPAVLLLVLGAVALPPRSANDVPRVGSLT